MKRSGTRGRPGVGFALKGRLSHAFLSDSDSALSDSERGDIDRAVKRLLEVYHGADHLLLREKIDALNLATHTLAENMMNTAVRGALKGTKI